MPTQNRRLPLVATAALALLALTGCDPTGSPTPSPTGSGTRTAPPTATPTPSATPTPTASADAAPTCENIITPATLATLTGSGLSLTPPAEFFAKVRSEIPAGFVSPWLFFEDNGGIICNWHNGFEVIETYGVVDLPADRYPAFRDAMVNSDPYLVEESDAVLFSSQMYGNPFRYVLVSSDGSTYLASELPLIDELKLAFP